jgi:hypothetical protein
MEYRDRIIKDIARRECKRISRKTILALQKMKDGMQSGEDSPLRNAWDEVCVQVQGDESYLWSAYQDTIEGIIQCEVDLLDLPTKKAIWLQTDGYLDWDEEDNAENVPWTDEDITRHILRVYVLSAAEGWHNRRIERYLDL